MKRRDDDCLCIGEREQERHFCLDYGNCYESFDIQSNTRDNDDYASPRHFVFGQRLASLSQPFFAVNWI